MKACDVWPMSGAKTWVAAKCPSAAEDNTASGEGYGEYGGRIVSGQKAGKPRINRGKGRIHGKIAKRQEYLVGQALHQGKGHGQRHIKACKRAGIEELLQPIAKFMGKHGRSETVPDKNSKTV